MDSIDQHTALIIIDLQAGAKFMAKHFFKDSSDKQFETVVKKNQQLLDAFLDYQLPVYLVTINMPLINRWFSDSLLELPADSAYTALQKSGASAFKGTNLAENLRKAAIKQILLSGFTLDNAIIKTLYDAQSNNIETIIISDATIAKNAVKATKILHAHLTIDTSHLLQSLSSDQR